MKPLLIIIVLAVPLVAADCPKGTNAYEGTCAAELAPEKAVDVPTPTSNEKPSKHPEPAWQRGEVNAVIVGKPGVEPSTSVANDTKAEAAGK